MTDRLIRATGEDEKEKAMAKYDLAPFAAINANAYLEYMAKHPEQEHIALTRGQLEAICRDLADYTDRDADATGWAEQATRSAGAINRLTLALERIRDQTKACEIDAAYHEAVIALDEQQSVLPLEETT